MQLRGDANSDNIAAYNDLPFGEPVPFGEWIHYAATYQRTDPNFAGEWALYYNGEFVDGGDANGSVAGTELEVLGNWGMGAFVGLVPDFNRQLVGSIDEFYLFKRALSEQEVGVLANPAPPNPNDCNGDGVVDIADVNCACAAGDTNLANAILTAIGSLAGDADGNGAVEFQDFTILANNFGKAGQYTDGDFDWNGMVEFQDFTILANNFGQSGGGGVAAVPEPSSLALALLGLGAVMFRRRRS